MGNGLEEKIELNALTDGLSFTPRNPTSAEYVKDASVYFEYTKVGPPYNWESVQGAGLASSEEIEAAFDWITGTLNGSDLNLEIFFDDSHEFGANVKLINRGDGRWCRIVIGLACVPWFMGISNRLLHLTVGSGVMLGATLQGIGIEKWDPFEDPIGRPIYERENELNSYHVCIDAMTLLFMHEAAHATGGHLWLRPDPTVGSNEFRRSMESDADWGSGYLYIKWAIEKFGASELASRETRSFLITRLVMASITLNFAMQLVTSDSVEAPRYHLPWNRTRDTLGGAYAAFLECNLEEAFWDLVNDAHQRVASIEYFVPHTFKHWIKSDDPRTLLDREIQENFTAIVIQEFRHQAEILEAGPIKGARRLWSRWKKNIIINERYDEETGHLKWTQRYTGGTIGS